MLKLPCADLICVLQIGSSELVFCLRLIAPATPVKTVATLSPMYSSGLLIIHTQPSSLPSLVTAWIKLNCYKIIKRQTGIVFLCREHRSFCEVAILSWLWLLCQVSSGYGCTHGCHNSPFLAFTLFEINATRQQNNETDRAFHHKQRLCRHFLHRVETISEKQELSGFGGTVIESVSVWLCVQKQASDTKRCMDNTLCNKIYIFLYLAQDPMLF